MQTLSSCKICDGSFLITLKRYEATSSMNADWKRVFETVLRRTTPLPIRLSLCPRCGFIFYRDVFDFEEVARLYSKENRFEYNRKKTEARGGNEEQRRQLRFFDAWMPWEDIRSILNVGAGDFTLEDELLDRFPDKSFAALDPSYGSETYRKQVRVHRTMMEQFKPEHPFDLVFAIHILEHVSDLRSFMEKLSVLTRRWLYVEVPFQVGPGLFLNRSVNSQHINYFSPGTLRQLLERYGFRETAVEFDTDGYSYNGMPGMIRILAEKTGLEGKHGRHALSENLFHLVSPIPFARHLVRSYLHV